MATRGAAASRMAGAAGGGRTGRARGAGFGASTRSLISSTSFWISSSSSAVAGVVVSAWRTRSKVEPRNARDVDDIGAAFALHDIEPEEVDSERRSAASRDVLELGREGKRVASLLRERAGGPNPDHAEAVAPD